MPPKRCPFGPPSCKLARDVGKRSPNTAVENGRTKKAGVKRGEGSLRSIAPSARKQLPNTLVEGLRQQSPSNSPSVRKQFPNTAVDI